LGGHALANLLEAVLPIVIMSAAVLLVGWRINGSAFDLPAFVEG